MNTITPRPFVAKDAQGLKTEDENSEEKTQDSLQQGNGGGQGQNRRQNQRTVAGGRAPGAGKKAFPKRPPAARRGKPVKMSSNPQQTMPPKNIKKSVPNIMPNLQQGVSAQQIKPPLQATQMPQQPRQTPVMNNPQTQKQANDQTKNNKVNIAQVIKDFRGTYAAIGTPQCLVEEVESYLQDVEQHTKGEAPSINYVQTNLLNAAVILDRYISETLEKESRVVQNWLDALFLQRINYRYNDGEINQAFLVKFPEGDTPQQPDSVLKEEEQQPAVREIPDYEPVKDYVPESIPEPKPMPVAVQEPVIQPVHPKPIPPVRKKTQITIIPEDNELKALFVQAKKQAYSNNPAKAMNIFQKALQRAVSINDGESQSKICYEMGRIYDDNNYLAQALNSYNRSLNVTTDTTVKTKAHYSMAKIYDDVNQVDSAINHYITSVSYAGVDDDLSSQSKSLTNIANIYTDKYNQDAFVFYDEADILINQTDDYETKGYVSSSTAGAYNKFNKPAKALKCYASAVKNYSDARIANSVAENYHAAGELMYDLKNPAKAKILLKKALAHTNKYKDRELIAKINDLLEEIG